MFKAGTMTTGTFVAPATTVQAASSQTIGFVLTNALPSKTSNPLYNSRIIVLMPVEMYEDDEGLGVISMDNALQGMKFRPDRTYDPGTGVPNTSCAHRVCYVITHENLVDIPAGTNIKLSLLGTANQESVKMAGDFEVRTQLYEIASDSNTYPIDEGAWPSNFLTTAGSVATTTGASKGVEASSMVTYATGVRYTLYFTTDQYIPKGGTLVVKLPSDPAIGEVVEITSSPADISTSASGLSYSSHTKSTLTLKAS